MHHRMDSEEYKEWRSQPATEEFFRYLAEFRSHLLAVAQEAFQRQMQDSWSADTVQRQARLQTEFSSKAQVLQDLVELEHSAIEGFYSEQSESDRARRVQSPPENG